MLLLPTNRPSCTKFLQALALLPLLTAIDGFQLFGKKFSNIIGADQQASRTASSPTTSRIEYQQQQQDAEYQQDLDELLPSLKDSAKTKPTLVPLSCDPIMLTTSEPLLTPEECNLVSGFLEFMAAATYEPDAEFDGDVADIQKGADLLSKVRDQIDDLTGCPTHGGEKPIPQYVVYEPKDAIEGGRPPTRHELLTYGLHVDTNNGEDLRHLTCLLYLNSNEKGATNFPLARPYDGTTKILWKKSNRLMRLRQAARRLIQSDVQHTAANEVRDSDIVEELEQAAVDLYGGDETQRDDTAMGLRVLPSAGHVCIFTSLDDKGKPDPSTFHGGEALIGSEDQKKILTFFKEVPREEFTNDREFTKWVRQKKEYLLGRYF